MEEIDQFMRLFPIGFICPEIDSYLHWGHPPYEGASFNRFLVYSWRLTTTLNPFSRQLEHNDSIAYMGPVLVLPVVGRISFIDTVRAHLSDRAYAKRRAAVLAWAARRTTSSPR